MLNSSLFAFLLTATLFGGTAVAAPANQYRAETASPRPEAKLIVKGDPVEVRRRRLRRGARQQPSGDRLPGAGQGGGGAAQLHGRRPGARCGRARKVQRPRALTPSLPEGFPLGLSLSSPSFRFCGDRQERPSTGSGRTAGGGSGRHQKPSRARLPLQPRCTAPNVGAVLRQYELLEKVRAYDPDADEAMINRAYVFSMKAHGSQKRASGDPYYSHPIEVAGILTDLHLDDETIVTAILHDTIEDTVATHEEIERLFGPSVARLVDGVTKLSKIEAQSESQRAAENLRKFLLAMSGDIRVLLVKLADRLHNMRTLHFISNPEKRKRIARETMDIYAPLAERIGMYEFMTEMQTLAFKELEPDAFASISRRLEQLHKGEGDLIERIARGLKAHLEANGIDAEVQGREKHPYSIWRKMAERHVSFEQLSDVMAFRAVVGSSEECYRTLGLIHRRWPMVPGRFKDFISTPKRNGYSSIHTTVIHDEQMRIEIQIRTRDMHARAEHGLAAHWAYKEGKAAASTQHPWISDLIEILEHAASAEELLEHTRMAMYQDRIFAFTPKAS
jgi:(p)ppGpp synthase/HD superfamily hydrolase